MKLLWEEFVKCSFYDTILEITGFKMYKELIFFSYRCMSKKLLILLFKSIGSVRQWFVFRICCCICQTCKVVIFRHANTDPGEKGMFLKMWKKKHFFKLNPFTKEYLHKPKVLKILILGARFLSIFTSIRNPCIKNR